MRIPSRKRKLSDKAREGPCIIPQAEGSQSPSVQLSTTTTEMTALGHSHNVLIKVNLHQDNRKKSSRKRNLSEKARHGSSVQAKATRLAEPTSATMESTLSYCRPGINPQAEGGQPSSIQSTTTAEMTALDSSTNWFIGDYLHQDNETDSIWLVKVLNAIGANDAYRKMCHDLAITCDTIDSFTSEYSFYSVGSRTEGTATPGAPKADSDVIRCIEKFPVIEDISQADKNIIRCLLLVNESDTPTGYVKLQLVFCGVPCTKDNWPCLCNHFSSIKDYCKFDRSARVVLFDLIDKIFVKQDNPCVTKYENKPALKIHLKDHAHTDLVTCYRCKSWPSMANEWLFRYRCNNWPRKETIDELKLLGFFVVRKGHPDSLEIDLEWRVSLSLQERTLMFHLTDVQYKCYVVLKMLNRDVLQLNCITSYHWKTCLFYTIEGNELIVWENKFLFRCVKLCIKQMLKWVKCGVCPNYFIPSENMFKGRMNTCLISIAETKLVELFKDRFACLLQVQSDNLGTYMHIRSQKNNECFEKLRAESAYIYKVVASTHKTKIYLAAMHSFGTILGQNASNKDILRLIDFLWEKVNSINVINENSSKEKQRALLVLQDMVYTSLAGNISAMSIQQVSPPLRDFLFTGCYTFFMRGGLNGRLKFISVLYAAGCYKECKWYLDQENEKCIQSNPSVCLCHNIQSILRPLNGIVGEMSQLKMSTCVIFLPTELPITPDALKFEMFRYFGMSSDEREREDYRWRWHYWAVVDSNIYYFFLRFLINLKLTGVESSTLCDIDKISDLISGSNVSHLDVSYNLMAWCYLAVGFIPEALNMSKRSWGIKLSSFSTFLYATKEMKRKHYQFNSAKIYWLVILYNIWFTIDPSGFKFCFQCFKRITDNKKCSGCRTDKYCSKQCQKQNWAIHQTICKIVKNYYHV